VQKVNSSKGRQEIFADELQVRCERARLENVKKQTVIATQLLSTLRIQWSLLDKKSKEWFEAGANKFRTDVLNSAILCRSVTSACDRYVELVTGRPMQWPAIEVTDRSFLDLDDAFDTEIKIQGILKRPIAKLDRPVMQACRVITASFQSMQWQGSVHSLATKLHAPQPNDFYRMTSAIQQVSLDETEHAYGGRFLVTRLSSFKLCKSDQEPIIELLIYFSNVGVTSIPLSFQFAMSRQTDTRPKEPALCTSLVFLF